MEITLIFIDLYFFGFGRIMKVTKNEWLPHEMWWFNSIWS